MTVNIVWLIFAAIVAAIIGWLIHFLIDFFFWRDRRICTETYETVGRLRADILALQNSGANDQIIINRLQSDLDGDRERLKERENALLLVQRDSETYVREIGRLTGEAKGLQSVIARLEKELDHLTRRLEKAQDSKDAGPTVNKLTFIEREILDIQKMISGFGGSSGISAAQLDGLIGRLSGALQSTDRSNIHISINDHDLSGKIASSSNPPAPDGEDLFIRTRETVESENLAEIWGIGDDTRDAFIAAGFRTFADLCDEDRRTAMWKVLEDMTPAPGWFELIEDDDSKEAAAFRALWIQHVCSHASGGPEKSAAFRSDLQAAQKSFQMARSQANLTGIYAIGPTGEKRFNECGLNSLTDLADPKNQERIVNCLQQSGHERWLSTLKGKYKCAEAENVAIAVAIVLRELASLRMASNQTAYWNYLEDNFNYTREKRATEAERDFVKEVNTSDSWWVWPKEYNTEIGRRLIQQIADNFGNDPTKEAAKKAFILANLEDKAAGKEGFRLLSEIEGTQT